ncbi:MAG: F0F1 ATP synthase subunit B [Patescibacteria group bacterium]
MELIEQLGLDWRLLLAQIVNFFILLLILKKFAYGPILEALHKRKDRIVQAEKNAEQVEKNLAQSQQQREQLLAETRTEAQALIVKATEQGKKLQEEMTAQARKDVEKIVSDAHEQINAARDQMLAQAREEISALVIACASKVLEHEVDEKENAKLIEHTLEALAKK